LWDGRFCPISIFKVNEYLEEDVKIIVCSLYRITAFIRQRKLDGKIGDDILQIAECGFAA